MSEQTKPALMPEHCAVLAVDTIGSGGNAPEHLTGIPVLVRRLAEAALHAVGISGDAAVDEQFTGDGFMRTYPSRFLPALVDMVNALDGLLTAHNQSAKPEIRLRLALHVGPLPRERGFYRPNIDVNRLLGAATFKHVVEHCQAHVSGDRFTTALVLSEGAHKTVFGGDYTRSVDRHEFAPVQIKHNEFDERCWVRVAGVNPKQIVDATAGVSPSETPPTSADQLATGWGERSINNSGTVHGHQLSGDGNNIYATPNVNVSNYVGGTNTGIQAGVVNGGINLNRGQR
ncbi:hypothetical protein SAMN05421805_104104 [Saccharopolyspora antimicrobica]|uniref:Adenylate cyclase, class 3 n=1 Tax=Saccharopolyspora antimicrobica TaxID=455193 RepID=A0A1I4YEY3_9PSEU|nr:hypothetical protein [Saccharopolyspora antimicrobica]RKT82636.1 hypothetical protein ATL45_0889 [Saccharopolyspora antimicrobica]SFN36343.1 hypothetical protein SAMN05421805_104104 [Saccharopolyspora antimicrobica]